MTRMIDLHVHTTASDGTFTPSDVVLLAKKAGLAAMAITDHDTVGGIEEAVNKAKEENLELIEIEDEKLIDERANIVAVKEENLTSPKTLALVSALSDSRVADYISASYGDTVAYHFVDLTK